MSAFNHLILFQSFQTSTLHLYFAPGNDDPHSMYPRQHGSGRHLPGHCLKCLGKLRLWFCIHFNWQCDRRSTQEIGIFKIRSKVHVLTRVKGFQTQTIEDARRCLYCVIIMKSYPYGENKTFLFGFAFLSK